MNNQPALAVIAFSVVSLPLLGAPQEAMPAFDVASIRRDFTSDPSTFLRIIPTLHIERMTPKGLINTAWHLHDFEVTGGPDWINTERYDVDAKGEPPRAVDMEFRDLQLLRLRSLLGDRFHLRSHRAA